MVHIIIKNSKKNQLKGSDFDRGYDPQEVKERKITEQQLEAAVFNYTRDVALQNHEQRKLYDQYYDKNK